MKPEVAGIFAAVFFVLGLILGAVAVDTSRHETDYGFQAECERLPKVGDVAQTFYTTLEGVRLDLRCERVK